MTRRERIIEAVREADEAEIAYQQAKERRRAANAALDALLGEEKRPARKKPRKRARRVVSVPPPSQETGASFPDLDRAGLRRGSRPYQIATLLQQNPDDTYTGAEIARALDFGRKEKATLYADLKRLAEERGLIEKVPPKHWQACRLNGTEAPP